MKKIAFFRIWSKHPIDQTIPRVLADNFPEFQVETITLDEVVFGHWGVVFINLAYILKEYGLDHIMSRKKFRTAFWRTTYIFKWVKHWASEHISKSPHSYAFSFQIQSLFDTGTSGLPHFVYTDHTHLENLNYPDFDPSQMVSPEHIELEKNIYTNAALVMTRSTNISRSLIQQYDIPEEKVCCVYAGSNIEIDAGVLENDDYGNKKILFVGADWERKGGPDLVEAFKMVLEKIPDAHLTIVGSTPIVNLPNCEIVGRIPPAEMPRYYRQTSIFCLPTKLEPFGIVFIEAMSYKLPVIATLIGAIPDFVSDGESGYLVEPGDVDGLACALILLLDDAQKCRTFGESGYNKATSRYNWDHTGKMIRDNVISIVGQLGSVDYA